MGKQTSIVRQRRRRWLAEARHGQIRCQLLQFLHLSAAQGTVRQMSGVSRFDLVEHQAVQFVCRKVNAHGFSPIVVHNASTSFHRFIEKQPSPLAVCASLNQ